jgi:outer membrane receptor protein involved in Fe transport
MLVFAPALLNAQSEEVIIIGTVVERSNDQPIEFATAMIGDKASQQPISGVTTDINGAFELRSRTDNFYVEISFIGFNNERIEEFELSNGRIDLGTIYLAVDNNLLEEVIVRGERSTTEFKLDKRVFNVGKDLSSTGASVLEVLNNVPSVNVSIEGNISLRGSNGVQILINGKPSVMASEQGNALGTITAEMIDRIEVITNPSAKYDAEGTSGIINIVIKKEERKGFNGSASLNTGNPHNHSFGLSLNRRTEKFNLFSQLGVGYRELPNDVESINRDLINNTAVYSEGEEYRNETFYNVILGTDYHINPQNVLTISGNFVYEVEDQPSQTNFRLVDETDSDISKWYRQETTEATNPKWRYEVQYKSDFKDHEDHTLLFSALGNFFGKDQSSEFNNVVLLGDKAQNDQQTRTAFKEAKYTFKLDYTKPLSDKFSLETGAQYVLQHVSNDYEVKDLIEGDWIQDPGLTNLFEYDQNVLGVYGTGAYEDDKWGLKLGLRVENTDLQTLLTESNESNDQNYTNLFPSAHTSYKLTEQFSLQAGYSRRVYRPRLWDLNPFFNIRNTYSIRTGNPDLKPEYTDSYEVAGIYIFDKTSINFSVYHRYTTDVIERVSTFKDNVNTYKPDNVGVNRATGVEFNAKYSPKKWFTLTGDINYNYYDREGSLEGISFDFNSDQWSSKWTAKLKLPADIDFEVSGQYRSEYKTVQGNVSSSLFGDLGLRKKLLKGKGVVSLSVRDVFNSRVREGETLQDDYYIYSKRQRGRFVSVGFSYGFGKGEAMEYSGQRRRH